MTPNRPPPLSELAKSVTSSAKFAAESARSAAESARLAAEAATDARITNQPNSQSVLKSLRSGASTGWVVVKYVLVVIGLIGLIVVVLYLLKALGVFDPSPDDYNRVVEQFNLLAGKYNHAVRRSYMVYIKVGAEASGLPVSVKLVTTNGQQAIEITPVFQGVPTDQAIYDDLKSNNAAVMCYQEKKIDDTAVCARTNFPKSEAPKTVDECYTTLCKKGPTCTIRTPYTNKDNRTVWSSEKRALGLSVYMNKFGTMQIRQLSLQSMDGPDGLNFLNEAKGQFAPEFWDVFGKIWTATNYDMQKTAPTAEKEIKEMGLDKINFVYVLPSDIQENSYYKLWINATGAVAFDKATLPEYTQSVTDEPLAPLLSPVDPVEELEDWKEPIFP